MWISLCKRRVVSELIVNYHNDSRFYPNIFAKWVCMKTRHVVILSLTAIICTSMITSAIVLPSFAKNADAFKSQDKDSTQKYPPMSDTSSQYPVNNGGFEFYNVPSNYSQYENLRNQGLISPSTGSLPQ